MQWSQSPFARTFLFSNWSSVPPKHCIHYFLVTVNKIPTSSKLREKGFILVRGLKWGKNIVVRKVETELEGNRSRRHSQEAETANWYSAPLLHRMVLPTLTVGLSFSVKPFCKCPHRHSQRYALMVALNPTKLTIKGTHRRQEPPKSLQLSLPKSPFCFLPL